MRVFFKKILNFRQTIHNTPIKKVNNSITIIAKQLLFDFRRITILKKQLLCVIGRITILKKQLLCVVGRTTILKKQLLFYFCCRSESKKQSANYYCYYNINRKKQKNENNAKVSENCADIHDGEVEHAANFLGKKRIVDSFRWKLIF